MRSDCLFPQLGVLEDEPLLTVTVRLPCDSKAIFEDQVAAMEHASRDHGEESANLALLTDGLRAEREQGITTDVAYRYFATPRRKLIIADATHATVGTLMITGALLVGVTVPGARGPRGDRTPGAGPMAGGAIVSGARGSRGRGPLYLRWGNRGGEWVTHYFGGALPHGRLYGMTRAGLDKRPTEVAAMFDALASRYDLMNDILSMGQVRLWRRRVQRILRAGPGDRVLDLAAGTGTSSVTLAAAGADVVACDFSFGMLAAGQARITKSDPSRIKTKGRIAFAAGDALRLPFADGAFDAVTISFGLRNVAGTRDALAEMRRVTRAGGRLVVCEFSRITVEPVDMIYRRYLTGVLPAVARRAARNPEAYEYLAESISDWPAQRELADLITAAGWSAVRWRDLTLGVVAVHVARNL